MLSRIFGTKPTHYRVAHLGMGFPIGSVLPASAFPSGVEGHLHIGSLVETTDPVNVDLPASMLQAELAVEKPAQESPTIAAASQKALDIVHAELRQEIADTAARSVAARKALAEAEVEIDRLNKLVAELTTDRDEWKSLAEFSQIEQKNRDPESVLPLPTQ